MKRLLFATAVVFLLLAVIGVASTPAPANANGLAFGCRDSKNPDAWGVTLETGTGWGSLPGHNWIGFKEPLPRNYTIVGGSYQYWKSENGMAKFLISGAWWNFKMEWENKCGDFPSDYAPWS